MTHSFSQTVLTALLYSHNAGRQFCVIATESQPQCEGRLLAQRLEQAGIAVTLIADAAMVRSLSEAQLILVGADAIMAAGLVNKAGTAVLAQAAQALGKPMYALASTLKLTGDRIPTSAILDLTPLDSLTAAVTEDGILSPAEIRRLTVGDISG